MVIISFAKIRKFYERHPDAEDALSNWYRLVESEDWKDFNDIKKIINSVDAIGNGRYVFNIRGNRYRIVAVIIFKTRTVYIRFVGTHAEYDRTDVTAI